MNMGSDPDLTGGLAATPGANCVLDENDHRQLLGWSWAVSLRYTSSRVGRRTSRSSSSNPPSRAEPAPLVRMGGGKRRRGRGTGGALGKREGVSAPADVAPAERQRRAFGDD